MKLATLILGVNPKKLWHDLRHVMNLIFWSIFEITRITFIPFKISANVFNHFLLKILGIVHPLQFSKYMLRKKVDKWTLSVFLGNVYYNVMLTATKQF